MQFSEVDVKARKRAAKIMHEAFMKLIKKIRRGEEPELVLPKRTLANTVWDAEQRILRLGEGTLTRKFLDASEAKKFMKTVLMASIIYEALLNDEYPTIRDLYYRGKHTIVYRDHKGRRREENTWDEQKESDAVITDVEVYTGLLREEMLILSKEKGKVVGNMRIRSGGDVIDLSKMGHGAYAIEPTPDLIEFIDVDAEYVLVIEKDAVFQQLHRIKFWDRYKCLLVTSSGQPDRATRRFVRRLNEELGLPVYVLTDADPYGWYIYSVFRSGSITLSYESERLATPSAKFLGVSMSDIFEKNWLSPKERKNVIIKAKDTDIKRAKEMMRYQWFQSRKWKHEINLFLKKKSKLEIEALAVKGLKFLSEVYIPQKIQTGDWIE
ncbi:DNA topoisomerase VI subunit A [Ignicoccus pacificus DSM 13166]|uniref:Type 2 DNA topoisomerase 6 subunit A n=1 Tax=Ignicoccus pacificus DSM 13166 TaxID=940294 RepID=A0A977PJH0_9CREN|nr:DNA topoisomerase VI subunit A [Ignicoccus pacificus DSM 13166]